MYDEGWKNLVNIDVSSSSCQRQTASTADCASDFQYSSHNLQYSPALIEQMKIKHSELRPEMTWLEMDIRKLEFDDDSFDIALDKGRLFAPFSVNVIVTLLIANSHPYPTHDQVRWMLS